MDDLVVTISFDVKRKDGTPWATVAVTYHDNNVADVLALEKLVIPKIVDTLLAAGEAYTAATGAVSTATAPLATVV